MAKGGGTPNKKKTKGSPVHGPAPAPRIPEVQKEIRAISEHEKAVTEAAEAATIALNTLPVFAIANSDKKPLAYSLRLGIEGQALNMAIFYADVEAAKAQLAETKKRSPDLGCDLITVGLGTAHRLQRAGKAMLVPNDRCLRAAGAPEGVQAMGVQLPLFVCTKMLASPEASTSTTASPRPIDMARPVFMSHADCAEAVAHAQTALATGEEPLEISTLTLDSVYEQLANPSGSPGRSFSFVPPSASLAFTESYLGHGVYMRKIEDERDAVPPLQ